MRRRLTLSPKRREAAMKRAYLSYLVLALALAGRAEAQYQLPPVPASPAPVAARQPEGAHAGPLARTEDWTDFGRSAAPGLSSAEPASDPTHVWVSADYLLWWMKKGPLSTPLVTTGSTDDPVPGALGQPGTRVLFGNSNLNYDTTSGLRLAAGVWLPDRPYLGIEGSFFALERRSVSFTATSDANGEPLIARPVVSALDGSEFAYLDASPGVATGGVNITSTSRLRNFDLSLAACLTDQCDLTLTLLAGFRYLDLQEDLRILDSISPQQAGVYLFQTGPADPPSTLNIFDSFSTINRFYGAQFGGRLNWAQGGFDLSVTGKLALGVNQAQITVAGNTSLVTPGADTVTGPGGILAQPTNSGRVFRNQFSVVPELDINLGYQITRHLKAVVGYNFLYWTNLARPGEQIDRTVNFTQVQIDPTFGPLTGPARPALTPRFSDFWATGFNFGIEIQF
jgi:hypothetical protein